MGLYKSELEIGMTDEAKDIQQVDDAAEQANTFLQVIDKAATNPEVDAEKLHRILDAQERILDRNARMAFNQDLAAMSDELPSITEGGKIEHSGKIISRYARWDEDINPVIKPILSRHGFNLRFRTGRTDDGYQMVTAVLSHREGHSEETTIYLPSDSSGSKNSVQAVGSSTSYGKRYTASALLNLTTMGTDDDGETAEDKEPVTEDQAEEVSTRIGALVDAGKMESSAPFYHWMKTQFNANRIEDLDQKSYQEVCKSLSKKEKQQ